LGASPIRTRITRSHYGDKHSPELARFVRSGGCYSRLSAD
jgi:hypothetical protein